jgi:hypothetical protein
MRVAYESHANCVPPWNDVSNDVTDLTELRLTQDIATRKLVKDATKIAAPPQSTFFSDFDALSSGL